MTGPNANLPTGPGNPQGSNGGMNGPDRTAPQARPVRAEMAPGSGTPAGGMTGPGTNGPSEMVPGPTVPEA